MVAGWCQQEVKGKELSSQAGEHPELKMWLFTPWLSCQVHQCAVPSGLLVTEARALCPLHTLE